MNSDELIEVTPTAIRYVLQYSHQSSHASNLRPSLPGGPSLQPEPQRAPELVALLLVLTKAGASISGWLAKRPDGAALAVRLLDNSSGIGVPAFLMTAEVNASLYKLSRLLRTVWINLCDDPAKSRLWISKGS